MKVFVTGATGNVGSHLVPLLIADGHTVTCLCRSEKSAEAVKKQGAIAITGDLHSLDVIAAAARDADATIHLAFNHDFADPKFSMEAAAASDLEVIKTIGNALKGSGKTFIGTCGTLDLTVPNADRVMDDTEAKPSPIARGVNEKTLLDFGNEGVKGIVIRLPSFVYGNNIWGFITMAIDGARKAGASTYIGDGAGRFNTVHVEDAARIYALALTKGQPGIYNAIGSNTTTYKDMATAVGKLLNVEVKSIPLEQAQQAMGPFMAFAFSSNNPCSGSRAAKDLGWTPLSKTTIVDDVVNGSYKVRGTKQ